MKLALLIILVVTLLSFVILHFTTDRSFREPAQMPWHIKVSDAKHVEVFGIVLNQTSLEQARQHFGQLEALALYQNSSGVFSLEAYFGKVLMGRFTARIIANLEAGQEELEALTLQAVKRVKTEDGSDRWTLNPDQLQAQGLRKISTLSYIPDYSGLDGDFIVRKFGEPATRLPVSETAQLWTYPDRGVRILIDSQGKEIFEYLTPAGFKLLEEKS